MEVVSIELFGEATIEVLDGAMSTVDDIDMVVVLDILMDDVLVVVGVGPGNYINKCSNNSINEKQIKIGEKLSRKVKQNLLLDN